MLNIPVIRWGKPYDSLEIDEVLHFATGEPIAKVSQANAGIISRDMRQVGKARDTLRVIAAIEMVGDEINIVREGSPPMGELACKIIARLIRREDEEHDTLPMSFNVFGSEFAYPFFGTAAANGDEPGQPSIGGAVYRQRDEALAVHELQLRTDENFLTHRFRFRIGAHYAGKRVDIGDGDCGVPEGVSPAHILTWM